MFKPNVEVLVNLSTEICVNFLFKLQLYATRPVWIVVNVCHLGTVPVEKVM